jgi:hypothetical protein
MVSKVSEAARKDVVNQFRILQHQSSELTRYPGLLAVRTSSARAVVSGSQAPPGSWAHTRITPSSVTTHVAHPLAMASPANQSTALM